jgi:HKD family nuclease
MVFEKNQHSPNQENVLLFYNYNHIMQTVLIQKFNYGKIVWDAWTIVLNDFLLNHSLKILVINKKTVKLSKTLKLTFLL